MRTVWDGIKTMSDMKQNVHNSNRLYPLGGKDDGAFAEHMNILSILVLINTIFVLSLVIV